MLFVPCACLIISWPGEWGGGGDFPEVKRDQITSTNLCLGQRSNCI